MITLITGSPGSGKTLYSLSQLLNALETGRPCFSDIDGLKNESIYPVPEDWRDCPDGAFIVLDECHQRWPASGKGGRSVNPVVQALDTHRHRGMDFLLVTQWPTKLDHEARTNAGEHIHIQRVMGAQTATLYRWPSVQTAPNDYFAKNSADSEIFKYPKKLYQEYASATVHTHKFRFPKKLIIPLLAFLVAAVLVVYRVGSGNTSLQAAMVKDLPNTPPQGQERSYPLGGVDTNSNFGVSSQLSKTESWVLATTVPQIAGCIASASSCRCYSQSGEPMSLDDRTCRDALENPLPFNIGVGSSSKIEQGAKIN